MTVKEPWNQGFFFFFLDLLSSSPAAANVIAGVSWARSCAVY